MSVVWLSPLLSQLVPEDVELTPGAVLAGIVVLAALGGSLTVLSTWWTRYSQGESVVPAARRPLVRIPITLLGLGLLVALMMSAAAVSASLSAADAEIDQERLVGALLQTVNYDLFLIVLLGLPVLLLRHRRVFVVEEDAVQAELLPEAESSASMLVGDDALAPVHSPPVPAPLAEPAEGRLTESPGFEEPWRLATELRIAAEVCLAAWLPTAALRMALLTLLQDDTQHPFLVLIQDGVGVDVLLLIAVTAVVLAPLMEELLYRVVILGGLLCRQARAASPVFAIGLTSVLFAFAHGFPDSVALLPLAVAIAWTWHQRRSYRTVVLVHFLFNGFNIVLAGLSIL